MTSPPIDDIRRAAETAFQNTQVFLAYAFGSRIEGRPRPDSDLDIGFYAGSYPGCGRLPIWDELGLEAELTRLLDVEVDLRNLAEASEEFRGCVLENSVRIYCSDEVMRVNLERELLSRYHDYKEIYRQMHETRLRSRVQRG